MRWVLLATPLLGTLLAASAEEHAGGCIGDSCLEEGSVPEMTLLQLNIQHAINESIREKIMALAHQVNDSLTSKLIQENIQKYRTRAPLQHGPVESSQEIDDTEEDDAELPETTNSSKQDSQQTNARAPSPQPTAAPQPIAAGFDEEFRKKYLTSAKDAPHISDLLEEEDEEEETEMFQSKSTPRQCDSWCLADPNPWPTVCTWRDCTECQPCPTPAPGAPVCANWCANNPESQLRRCEMDECNGCSYCEDDKIPMAKRKEMDYMCIDGQIAAGANILDQTWTREKIECLLSCEEQQGCIGFDYTTNVQADACRLVGAGSMPIINDAGDDNRRYCFKASYTCMAGEVQHADDILFTERENSAQTCGARCKHTSGCLAFDYTTRQKATSCRGIRTVSRAPNADGGSDNRRYCLEADIVYIQTVPDSDLCITTNQNVAANVRPEYGPCGNTRAEFEMDDIGGGKIRLKHPGSNLCLNLKDATCQARGKTKYGTCDGNQNLWTRKVDAYNRFFLSNYQSGLCLHAVAFQNGPRSGGELSFQTNCDRDEAKLMLLPKWVQKFICYPGAGTDCATCVAQEDLTADGQCLTCNPGYKKNGNLFCEAYICEMGTDKACVECMVQAQMTADHQCQTCNEGFLHQADTNLCEEQYNYECPATMDTHCLQDKCNIFSNRCGECRHGFTTSDDKTECLDVDECDQNSDICDPNADCNNVHGSYLCVCKEGYVGDGISCQDVCPSWCANSIKTYCIDKKDECGACSDCEAPACRTSDFGCCPGERGTKEYADDPCSWQADCPEWCDGDIKHCIDRKAYCGKCPLCLARFKYLFSGYGQCAHGETFASAAWSLNTTAGTKALDSIDYRDWVDKAWKTCHSKDDGVAHVTVTSSAQFRCYNHVNCEPLGPPDTPQNPQTEASWAHESCVDRSLDGVPWRDLHDRACEWYDTDDKCTDQGHNGADVYCCRCGGGVMPEVPFSHHMEHEGACNETDIYHSFQWQLAPSQTGIRGPDTKEYMRWVSEAWVRCLHHDDTTRHVAVWKNAGFRCYKSTQCTPNRTLLPSYTWTRQDLYNIGFWNSSETICRPGYTFVDTAYRCERAAQSMRANFFGTGSWARSSFGCQALWDQENLAWWFSFNDRDGARDPYEQPVCAQKTCADYECSKFTQRKRVGLTEELEPNDEKCCEDPFIRSSVYSATCPLGYQQVKNADVCSEAVQYLSAHDETLPKGKGLPYLGKGGTASSPYGCVADNHQGTWMASFNTHQGGETRNPSEQLICEPSFVRVATVAATTNGAAQNYIEIVTKYIKDLRIGDNIVISANTPLEERNVITGFTRPKHYREAASNLQLGNVAEVKNRGGVVRLLHRLRFTHPAGSTVMTISPEDPGYEALAGNQNVQMVPENGCFEFCQSEMEKCVTSRLSDRECFHQMNMGFHWKFLQQDGAQVFDCWSACDGCPQGDMLNLSAHACTRKHNHYHYNQVADWEIQKNCYWVCNAEQTMDNRAYQCSNCVLEGCVQNTGALNNQSTYQVNGVCYRANGEWLGCLTAAHIEQCKDQGKIEAVECPAKQCRGRKVYKVPQPASSRPKANPDECKGNPIPHPEKFVCDIYGKACGYCDDCDCCTLDARGAYCKIRAFINKGLDVVNNHAQSHGIYFKACEDASPTDDIEGAPDEFRGWYDVQECGKCHDYCRWIGESGSGGDPFVATNFEKSYWSCRLAGSDKENTNPGDWSRFPYIKCANQGDTAEIPGKRVIPHIPHKICHDKLGDDGLPWHDAEYDTCEFYSTDRKCQKYGAWGANLHCCSCGGGDVEPALPTVFRTACQKWPLVPGRNLPGYTNQHNTTCYDIHTAKSHCLNDDSCTGITWMRGQCQSISPRGWTLRTGFHPVHQIGLGDDDVETHLYDRACKAEQTWDRILHQKVEEALFSADDKGSPWTKNADDPDSPAYMNIEDNPDNSIRTDGMYRFKIIYHGLGDPPSTVQIEWVQSTWLTATEIQGFSCVSPEDCVPQSTRWPQQFNGLAVCTKAGNLFSSTNTLRGFWNSVGTIVPYEHGISAWNGEIAKEVELFVARPPGCVDPYTPNDGVETRTFYRAEIAAAPEICERRVQRRNCIGGTYEAWDGPFRARSCTIKARCSNPDGRFGKILTRKRYAVEKVIAPDTCDEQIQTRECTDDGWTDWTGNENDFPFTHCFKEVHFLQAAATVVGDSTMQISGSVAHLTVGANVLIANGTAQQEYNVLVGAPAGLLQLSGQSDLQSNVISFLHPLRFNHSAGTELWTIDRDDPNYEDNSEELITWVLIASQDLTQEMFNADATSTLQNNHDDPHSDAFMDISGDFSQFRINNKYMFKLEYDDTTTVTTLRWEQTSWLTADTVTGFMCMEPMDCGPSSEANANKRFGGLALSAASDIVLSSGLWNEVGVVGLPAGEDQARGWNGEHYSKMKLYLAAPAEHGSSGYSGYDEQEVCGYVSNNNGTDMENMPVFAVDACHCRDLCRANHSCEGWMYSHQVHVDAAGRGCHLKSTWEISEDNCDGRCLSMDASEWFVDDCGEDMPGCRQNRCNFERTKCAKCKTGFRLRADKTACEEVNVAFETNRTGHFCRPSANVTLGLVSNYAQSDMQNCANVVFLTPHCSNLFFGHTGHCSCLRVNQTCDPVASLFHNNIYKITAQEWPCTTGSNGTSCATCRNPEDRFQENHCATCQDGHWWSEDQCVSGTAPTTAPVPTCTLPQITQTQGAQNWQGQNCASGASNVAAGTECVIVVRSGFTCTQPGTCRNNGQFQRTAACQAVTCTLPSITSAQGAEGWHGGTGCASGATVAAGTTCSIVVKDGFTCVQPGECGNNGNFARAASCAVITCTVPTITEGAASWSGANCASGANNVAIETVCGITAADSFTCTSPGRCLGDGTFANTARCQVNTCDLPTIAAAGGAASWSTGCASGATGIAIGTTCTITPVSGWWCHQPGECGSNGNFAQTASCRECSATLTDATQCPRVLCDWCPNNDGTNHAKCVAPGVACQAAGR